MKKIIRFAWVNTLVGVAIAATLVSFAPIAGSHNFQVYLDNKLMIDQYVSSNMQVPVLSIDPADNYHELIVKYNECGRTVTGRTVSIRDEENHVLKQWHFEAAASGFKDPMVLPMKDILALKQTANKTLKLYYSSKEFSEGQQLAALAISAEGTTALK
jgi:hypothetical protein